MALGQIVAGAGLALKLAFGTPDSTEVADTTYSIDKELLNEIKLEQAVDDSMNVEKDKKTFKLSSETQYFNDNFGTENSEEAIPKQRITLTSDKVKIVYDAFFQTVKDTVAEDIAGMMFPIKEFGNHTFSGGLYTIGNFDENTDAGIELSHKFDNGSFKTSANIGAMWGEDTKRWDWIVASAENKNIFVKGMLLSTPETVNNDTTQRFEKYLAAGVDLGNVYVGAGAKNGSTTYMLGLKDLGENFGMFAFGNTNPNGDWNFTSRTSFKGKNKANSNRDFFNFVIDHITTPRFFPTHFSPFMNKGDITLKFDGQGREDAAYFQLEAGAQVTPYLQIGGGIDTKLEDGKLEVSPIAEIYVPMKLGNRISANLEGKYSARTGDLGMYLVMKVDLGAK